jgi:predicted nucleic acid-binding protein
VAYAAARVHGARGLEDEYLGVAVYDTLFVELAEREQAPLVTFDRRLLES